MLPGWRLESNWLKKGKFDSKNGSFISHQGKGKGKIWGQNIKENEEEGNSINLIWKKDENKTFLFMKQ